MFKQVEIVQNHMKSLWFNLIHLFELVDAFALKDVPASVVTQLVNN